MGIFAVRVSSLNNGPRVPAAATAVNGQQMAGFYTLFMCDSVWRLLPYIVFFTGWYAGRINAFRMSVCAILCSVLAWTIGVSGSGRTLFVFHLYGSFRVIPLELKENVPGITGMFESKLRTHLDNENRVEAEFVKCEQFDWLFAEITAAWGFHVFRAIVPLPISAPSRTSD